MRQITPLNLPDVMAAHIDGNKPDFKVVSPSHLYVDERYQRDLTKKSIKLITKIVSEWDWAAFKPPVVVKEGDCFHVIDGQHTAIAAITHGGILEIPVMIIDADSMPKRANSFVRHNRDRITVTPLQLYHAQLAAGDEDAMTIQQVCERAGVEVLRYPPNRGIFKPCETIAVGAINGLVDRRYAKGAREVLEICAKAKLAPITVTFIHAVDCLLFDSEYRGKIDQEKLVGLILSRAKILEREAKRYAAEHKLTHWRALASVLFMNVRRRG